MVVALFLIWVDEIGLGGVEEGAGSIDVADEVPAAHEHDRVVVRLVGMAVPGGQPTNDIGDLYAAVVKQLSSAQHLAASADTAQQCPRLRRRASAHSSPVTSNRTITVYGAYGHTGRFVVAELRRRGWTPVLSGRDPNKLRAAAEAEGPLLEVRPASVESTAALDSALAGAAAVINCAGPFFYTAAPVIDAALRAGIPYLDVAAEIEAVADTLERYDDLARKAGLVVIPAMAFFGGLGDLLATAATQGWTAVDEIVIAYGLSSWNPTMGTLNAGQVSRGRRDGRRIVYSGGRLELRTDSAPTTDWEFPLPLGRQQVIAQFTMADSVTIPRHIATPEIRSFMTMAAVKDVTDPNPSPPVPCDETRRSGQTFVLDVLAKSGTTERRGVATGRDIYAISAPLVVEATKRVLQGLVTRTGTLTAGQAFDAVDFLHALPLDHISLLEKVQAPSEAAGGRVT